MKSIIFCLITLILFSCKKQKAIKKIKTQFVYSSYQRSVDSAFNARRDSIMKLEQGREDYIRFPPSSIGVLNFVVIDKDSSFIYIKPYTAMLRMCGTFSKEEEEWDSSIRSSDALQKISNNEFLRIINFYKAIFQKNVSNNTWVSPSVTIALAKDTIKSPIVYEARETLEHNRMQNYCVRMISNFEEKAINDWNSLTSQQQRQLNIQRHNKLYQSN